MISIVDYGVGNLFSLSSSLKSIGADTIVTNDKQKILDSSAVILPGVGAFSDAKQKLQNVVRTIYTQNKNYKSQDYSR